MIIYEDVLNSNIENRFRIEAQDNILEIINKWEIGLGSFLGWEKMVPKNLDWKSWGRRKHGRLKITWKYGGNRQQRTEY